MGWGWSGGLGVWRFGVCAVVAGWGRCTRAFFQLRISQQTEGEASRATATTRGSSPLATWHMSTAAEPSRRTPCRHSQAAGQPQLGPGWANAGEAVSRTQRLPAERHPLDRLQRPKGGPDAPHGARHPPASRR